MKDTTNIYLNPRFFDITYKIKESFLSDSISDYIRDNFSGMLSILFVWPGENGRLYVKVVNNKGAHLTTEFDNLTVVG